MPLYGRTITLSIEHISASAEGISDEEVVKVEQCWVVVPHTEIEIVELRQPVSPLVDASSGDGSMIK